jgi:chromosome segregation ATPase
MGNEKYINYYIEILTSTLNDCVIRNVSMQANSKISDEIIKEQAEKIEQLSVALKEFEEVNRKLKEGVATNENNTITDLRNKISEKDFELKSLLNQINELNNRYKDYETFKSQSTHIDTFKLELIKSREELSRIRGENDKQIDILNKKHEEEKADLQKQITDLNAKIDYLQLSPAKRKKIDDLNKGASTVSVVDNTIETAPVDDSAIKDGGTF